MLKLRVVKANSPAIHRTGNISREEDDIFIVYVYRHKERDDEYIGNWLTGFRLVDVHVKKKHCRRLTKGEAANLANSMSLDNLVLYLGGPIKVDNRDIDNSGLDFDIL